MSSEVRKRTLCITNLSQLSDKVINNLFGPYGMISHKIINSSDSNRKDVEVEFETEELANKARGAMHGRVVDGNSLFVDLAPVSQSPWGTSSTSDQQKHKGSVLDRIIKPPNPKNAEKASNSDIQVSGKDKNQQESKNSSALSVQTKITTDKFEKAESSSQPLIIKRNGFSDKIQDSNGSMDSKKHQSDNNQSKKSFNTQNQDQLNQQQASDTPHKLEIIKPKLEDRNSDFHKDIIITKPKHDSKHYDRDFESRNDSRGNTTSKKSDKFSSKSHQYGSSNRDRTISRSRSRSREKSRSDRYPESNLRIKPKSYNQPSYRRSSRSRTRSPRGPDYDSHKGFHSKDYNTEYRDSNRYRWSRSRSNPRREYSPYKESFGRRDDLGHSYKERSRSRHRSRTHSRDRDRDNHYRSRDRYSRSKSRSPYRDFDHTLNKHRTYKPEYTTKEGLRIERLESPKRRGNLAIREDEIRRRQSSRSLSREARRSYNHKNRSSRSRERRPQNGWDAKHHDYDARKSSKTPESSRGRKVLDVRVEGDVVKKQKQSKSDLKSDRAESKDKMGLKEERAAESKPNPLVSDILNIPSTAQISETMNMFANNMNQMIPSFLNPSYLPMLQASMMNFQNPLQFPYMNPMYLAEAREQPLNQLGNMQDVVKTQLASERSGGESVETAITQNIHEKESAMNEAKEGVNLSHKSNRDTVVGSSNLENKHTGSSNNTAAATKSEGKNSLTKTDESNQKMKYSSLESKEHPADQKEDDRGNGLNLDLLKTNKMKDIINYLVSTGDVQGLKEKLKLLEKSK